MTKFKYLIDPGHGGKHQITGEYVTPGKRMVKDDVVFYEGINNRIIAKLLVEAFERKGISHDLIVDSWLDIPLKERTNKINEASMHQRCILISIHSNGAGNGREWHSAKGNEVIIDPNASKTSRQFADVLEQEIVCNFYGLTKWRGVKEMNLHMTRESKCPAVLCEFGFFTNKDEVKLMQTDEWNEKVVKSICDAIDIFELNA
jgi:N-acetylmuramoyl-L-alanine amidase